MMWTFACVKTALHPESHMLPMETNEIYVSPASTIPSLDFWGSYGNANVHYLVDLIVPPFVSPTVIGEWFQTTLYT